MQYLTNYLCNKLIDQTFRGQSYAFPTTLEFGLFVTQPGKDGSGTEALDDTIWLAEAEDVLVSVGSVTVGVTTTLTETPDILAAGAFSAVAGVAPRPNRVYVRTRNARVDIATPLVTSPYKKQARR